MKNKCWVVLRNEVCRFGAVVLSLDVGRSHVLREGDLVGHSDVLAVCSGAGNRKVMTLPVWMIQLGLQVIVLRLVGIARYQG